MRKSMRKVLIGVLTSMLIVITMVATTYAWVGMLTYASVGQFDLNLKVNEVESDYNLLISSSGEYKVNNEGKVVTDTFDVSVDINDIKKQILDNYYDGYTINSNSISQAFNNITLTPVSPTISNGKINLNNFVEYDSSNKTFVKTNKLFKFDLYLSVDSSSGVVTSNTNYLLDLYLSNLDDSLSSTKNITGNLINKMTYKSNFIDSIEYDSNKYSTFNEILTTDSITTKSVYSTRFALEYYPGIPITASYEDTAYSSYEPLRQTIYYNGTEYPLYNITNDVYSFGNILSTDNNVAIQELNAINGIDIEKLYNNYASSNGYSNFDTLMSVRSNDLSAISENEVLCDGTSYVEVSNPYKSGLASYYEATYNVTSDTVTEDNVTDYYLDTNGTIAREYSANTTYYEKNYVLTSDTIVDNSKIYYKKVETNDIEDLKLGIINGTRYKVKVSVYFWFEGWDADCFSIIDGSETTLSLEFTSKFDDYE